MGREEKPREVANEGVVARRKFFRRLSAWEYFLLGILGLVILVCFVRPIYETWAGFRTSRTRKKIERLRNSSNVVDWLKLERLRRFSATDDLPEQIYYLIDPDPTKMGRYTGEIRHLAANALTAALNQDTTTTLRALMCGIEPLRDRALTGLHSGSADQLRDIARRCLDGDVRAREFVLRGSKPRNTSPIPQFHVNNDWYARWRIISGEIPDLDPGGAVPLIGEFLDGELNSTSSITSSIPVVWMRRGGIGIGGPSLDSVTRLIERYLQGADEADWPRTSRIVQAALAHYGHDPRFVDGLLANLGPQSARVLEEFVAGANSQARRPLLLRAAKGDLKWPPDVWIAVLDDHDPVVQILAARLLGYHGVDKAADALARRLGDRVAEVRLQAAWSLAVIGDERGRKALSRWAETGDSDPCEDLLEICQPVLPSLGLRPPGSFRPIPPTAPGYRQMPLPQTVGSYARGILHHIDAGGTMIMPLASWPRPGPPASVPVPAGR